MQALKVFLVGICFFLVTPSADAWNKAGHFVAAAVAYTDLKERNPAVLAKVIGILNEHPEVNGKWASQLGQVQGDARDLQLLMLASGWPDDVRKQYPEEWHFVNIPYRSGESGIRIPDGVNIIEGFSRNRSTVQSTTSSAQDRAKALCWMLHEIADIHQPLHSTKLVSAQFPEPFGDKGGNLFLVRYSPGNPTVKLHKLWDSLILTRAQFQAARNKAVKLRNRPDLTRDKFAQELAVVDFTDWAKASHRFAIEYVYLNGALKPSATEQDGVVPTDYQRKSSAVASRLIVLAAYRISDAMTQVLDQ